MEKYNLKARAKLNIGLVVKEKRSDNYHDIETYFHLLNLSDDIEIIIQDNTQTEIKINYQNMNPNWSTKDDLMYKAAHLYLNQINKTADIKINITKNIPTSAGLGGGSSDAAHIFLAINEYFNNLLSKEELITLSLSIGSDIAFFLSGFKAAKGEKRGEVLTKIDAVDYSVLIIKDTEKQSTKLMYEKLDELNRSIKSLAPFTKNLKKWQENYINDFEKISKVSPITKATKEKFPFAFSTLNGSGGSHSIVFQDKDLSIEALNFIQKSFPEKNVILLTSFCLFL